MEANSEVTDFTAAMAAPRSCRWDSRLGERILLQGSVVENQKPQHESAARMRMIFFFGRVISFLKKKIIS